MPHPNEKNIEIQLSEETAHGIYANLAIINHTDAEFVLDFIYLQPNAPKGKVRSRVILTPEHLKRFVHALSENIVKFEQKYGEITFRSQNIASEYSIAEKKDQH